MIHSSIPIQQDFEILDFSARDLSIPVTWALLTRQGPHQLRPTVLTWMSGGE
jgi:hypothetical protein